MSDLLSVIYAILQDDSDAFWCFCGFMDRHASDRVLVHCRKGSRASALVLLRRALAEGWSPEEVAAKGQAAGLPVEGGLRTLVEDYLRAHSSGL